ncbi:HAD family hydrolase [Frankia sp. CNm7]|uniref:HAD family hydrolase n=1 Tax=Frankia nepalensis TaxID=1836974 RepID=A0A937UM10_9ACTN|nr:haloacid dehalogenase-like hydrolase [Frankia nepalensis]MBL7501789.1 HAD family hydrolase [Frankia nepalensis]MBL7513885.1 HAD family hydrolase [Frankia nepalensis]MBL7523969.1 HAD family hydrolase [Frankia nepalensis]MBL7626357.1 HAD family hydrolase [Frankia nepalensis]
MPVRLVLWDIDQTLIDARGMGRLVYQRVFPTVTGVPLQELVALQHGRTELETIHDTLERHGLAASDEVVAGLLAALAAGFEAARAELAGRGRVLPGAREALGALAARTALRQSVLTGNTRAIAQIKVEAFGLDPFFDFRLGAFGDDHRDRAALVAVARDRAAALLGHPIEPDQVLLIGDTPNDVDAALTTGARILAVASGSYSVDDLRAAGAPTVVASLVDLTGLADGLFDSTDQVPAG